MLNITRQERQVILFLGTLALVGIAVQFLFQKYPLTKDAPFFNQGLFRVDLNVANKETLMEVAGIGKVLAERILKYRQEQGGFRDIEELKNIKGINNYKFEKLKEGFVVQ